MIFPCCKELNNAINEEFNSLRITKNKIVLCHPDLYSRDDKISFCPFCGMELDKLVFKN